MRAIFLASLLALPCLPALAQPVSLRGAVRVDEDTLATIRGGFTSPGTGLSVSFGIDRAVYVGGADAAGTLVQSSGSTGLVLVQQGTGNRFDVGALNALTAGTVVQNTLDNQKIQTVTTIDVRANSLQAWNGLNLQSSVSNAVTSSLRR